MKQYIVERIFFYLCWVFYIENKVQKLRILTQYQNTKLTTRGTIWCIKALQAIVTKHKTLSKSFLSTSKTVLALFLKNNQFF